MKMRKLAVLASMLAGVMTSTFASAHGDSAGHTHPLSNDKAGTKPNVIVVFVDDMGWGDLSSYGSPNISTPNLDKMAFEGQKYTNYYVSYPSCSASRSSLMTGRLPIRNGVNPISPKRRTFFPAALGGLPKSEVTLPELLKTVGYQTALIGKWHLGTQKKYLPTNQGFDYFYGTPYSNDMGPFGKNTSQLAKDLTMDEWPDPVKAFNTPLMENEKVIERPLNQYYSTQKFTKKALQYIDENKNQPFFLLYAPTMPHTPVYASPEFQGKSPRGPYGDAVQEVDWSVGQIVNKLKELGIAENTLVVFSSDNGPWEKMNRHAGSAASLYGGKANSWEGGYRVPGIFWWPNSIKPGIRHDIASTMDLLPTIANLAGAKLPQDRIIDGIDMTKALTDGAPTGRDNIIYYRLNEVFAARLGDFKAHFITALVNKADNQRVDHEIPLLFNVAQDPQERWNVADQYPEVIEAIKKMVAEHKKSVKPVEFQLEKYKDLNNLHK